VVEVEVDEGEEGAKNILPVVLENLFSYRKHS
jgi:hypothetical protein